METISQFGWEQLPHPPYSLDVAPSDFHLFSPLKGFLRGTSDEVKSPMNKWLKRFLRWRNTKLVFCCEKSVLKNRDYIEKWSKHFFSSEMSVILLQYSPNLLNDQQKLLNIGITIKSFSNQLWTCGLIPIQKFNNFKNPSPPPKKPTKKKKKKIPENFTTLRLYH